MEVVQNFANDVCSQVAYDPINDSRFRSNSYTGSHFFNDSYC